MAWLFICGVGTVIQLAMQLVIWLAINLIHKIFMISLVYMQQLLFKMMLLILLEPKTWWGYATLEIHQKHRTLIILLNFIVCLILEIPKEIKLSNKRYIINIVSLHILNHMILQKYFHFLYLITHTFIKTLHVILQFLICNLK